MAVLPLRNDSVVGLLKSRLFLFMPFLNNSKLEPPNFSITQDSAMNFDPSQQLVPLISRAEAHAMQLHSELRSAAAVDGEESGDGDFVDAEEDIARADTPASNFVDMTPGEDDDDDLDDPHETESNRSVDLFRSAFAGMANRGDDDENDENDEHAKGCDQTRRRMSTPPLPNPELIITGAAIKKQPASPISNLKSGEGRVRQGPGIDRDLSISLQKHFKFHDRVVRLVPRLNAEDFDWSRRYWIAVLLLGKKAKNATSEKDFIWMKGNRLSKHTEGPKGRSHSV